MRRRSSEIEGDVRVASGVRIGEGCRLLARGGTIAIGAGTVLGDNCRIVAHERVDLGRDCRLGDGVVVQDFVPIYDDVEMPVREQGLRTRPVSVGDGARLDHGACLGAGARVAPGATVGAHVVLEPLWPAREAATSGSGKRP